MSRFHLPFAAAAAVLFFVLTQARAGQVSVDTGVHSPAERGWHATLSTGWDSKYMFRGVDVLDGDSLHWTTLEASAFGLRAGAWFANGIGGADYSELDLYLGYVHTIGPVDLEAGYIYYAFPETDDETHEFYAGASYTGLGAVVPSLYYFHDVDLFAGGYLEGKVAGVIPVLGEMVTLSPYVLVSAGDYNTGDEWRWNNVQAGVELAVAVNEHLTITGYGAYSHALDAVRANPATEKDEFWGGASVTLGF